MLRPSALTLRRVQRKLIPAHSASHWEFRAVVHGRCGVVLKSGEKLTLQEKCLWVFPPHVAHGWHRESGECSVFAFYCGKVPSLMSEAVTERGYFERNISDLECRKIEEVARSTGPFFYERTAVSELRFERAIIGLSLIALGDA